MAVRSRRLFGPIKVIGGAFQQVFVVPDGRTAILRAIYMANASDTVAWPIAVRLSPGATGTGSLFQQMLAGGETAIIDRIVLNPGDVLWGRSNATNTPGVWLHGFGSLLLGAPE